MGGKLSLYSYLKAELASLVSINNRQAIFVWFINNNNKTNKYLLYVYFLLGVLLRARRAMLYVIWFRVLWKFLQAISYSLEQDSQKENLNQEILFSKNYPMVNYSSKQNHSTICFGNFCVSSHSFSHKSTQVKTVLLVLSLNFAAVTVYGFNNFSHSTWKMFLYPKFNSFRNTNF